MEAFIIFKDVRALAEFASGTSPVALFARVGATGTHLLFCELAPRTPVMKRTRLSVRERIERKAVPNRTRNKGVCIDALTEWMERLMTEEAGLSVSHTFMGNARAFPRANGLYGVALCVADSKTGAVVPHKARADLCERCRKAMRRTGLREPDGRNGAALDQILGVFTLCICMFNSGKQSVLRTCVTCFFRKFLAPS